MKDAASLAIQLMDLTSLSGEEKETDIHNLCHHAQTPYGHTAAICIYPRWVPSAKSFLSDQGLEELIKVATVTNFPQGSAEVNQAADETAQAIDLGADEVDVVLPYKALMEGNEQIAYDLVAACKKATRDKTLKVILETGELKEPELIVLASKIAISAGADFIKTSTGKVPINATPKAAHIMLQAIQDSGKSVGFKAAGGVRTLEDVNIYLKLAEEIMGSDWISPKTFRFGASGLLGNLIKVLEGQKQSNHEGY